METFAAAGAAAFVLSAVDYWRRVGFLRGLIALVVACAALFALGVQAWTAIVYGAAGAFLAMTAIGLVEWVLDHKAVTRVVR
jgi:hypothetical protein